MGDLARLRVEPRYGFKLFPVYRPVWIDEAGDLAVGVGLRRDARGSGGGAGSRVCAGIRQECGEIMIDVVMPQMGESIVEGTFTKWLKKPGERVERDEPLFEISTDKVDTEIPSPAAGTL